MKWILNGPEQQTNAGPCTDAFWVERAHAELVSRASTRRAAVIGQAASPFAGATSASFIERPARYKGILRWMTAEE